MRFAIAMQGILRYLTPVLLIASPALLLSAEPKAARPNIVFLLADDQGYEDCGFMGSTEIKTPNLDALARAGTVLKSFYVQPVCSPTRAALMTGRYPVHTGIFDYIRPDAKNGLSPQERTLADALRSAGYETAICGKWHLGRFLPAYRPLQRGFDHQYGLWGGSVNYFTHKNNKVMDWHRDDQPCDDEGYATQLIAQEACRMIRERSADKPLFLYVPFNAPHGPFHSPDQTRQPASNRDRYAAMLATMDEGIGKIVATVEEVGIRDNTLIIFASDNGGPAPGEVTSNGQLRAGKGTVYEGGVRVCACVNWPGVIPANKINNELLHIVDWYPTLVKLGGGSLEQKLPLDGYDIWPVLTQSSASPHESILLCGRSPRETALRKGDWKLIQLENGGLELYNLSTDSGEAHNLVLKQPDIVKKMRATIDHFMQQPRRLHNTAGAAAREHANSSAD